MGPQPSTHWLLVASVVLALASLAAACALEVWAPGSAQKAWAAFGGAVVYIVGLHTPPPSGP
jgi:hypothetical protein